MFKIVFNIIKIIFFAFLFCVTAWYWLLPESVPLAATRQKAADAAINRIMEDIRANRGTAKNAVLLHFDNDPTDYVSNTLRRQILSSGILDLEEVPLADRIRAKLHLKIPTYATLQEATDATTQSGADLIIWGQLNTFELKEDGSAVIDGQFHLIDAQTLQPIFTGDISAKQSEKKSATHMEEFKSTVERPASATDDARETPASAADDVRETPDSAVDDAHGTTIPLYMRILAFVLIALLLPMLTFPFLRSTASHRSNRANAGVLALYGAAGGILAFLLINGSFETTAMTILFFTAFIANVIYDLAMLSFATRLEE